MHALLVLESVSLSLALALCFFTYPPLLPVSIYQSPRFLAPLFVRLVRLMRKTVAPAGCASLLSIMCLSRPLHKREGCPHLYHSTEAAATCCMGF